MKYNIVDFTENIPNIKLPNYQKKILKLMEAGRVNKNSNIIMPKQCECMISSYNNNIINNCEIQTNVGSIGYSTRILICDELDKS